MIADKANLQALYDKIEPLIMATPCDCPDGANRWGHENYCWKSYLEAGLDRLYWRLTGKRRGDEQGN